jgi:hypothetical protein
MAVDIDEARRENEAVEIDDGLPRPRRRGPEMADRCNMGVVDADPPMRVIGPRRDEAATAEEHARKLLKRET